MRRKTFWMLVVALLIFVPVYPAPSPHPAAAYQTDEAWFVYLLYVSAVTEQAALIQVDATGASHEFPLDFVNLEGSAAFSPDGQLMAYCHADDTATQMLLWDIAAERQVWSRNFGSTSACTISRYGFSPTGDQVVVGVGSDNDHAGDGPHWRMVVLDTADGDIVTELNDQMESALVMGLDVFGAAVLVPVVKNFADDQLIFVLQTKDLNGGELQAYRWPLGAEQIDTIANWGKYGADFLPALGEIMWPEYEPDQASAATRQFPTTVFLADAEGTKRIYFHPDTMVFNALYVNDGRQVLVQLGRPHVNGTLLALIARDGTVEEEIIEGAMNGYLPAPAGYVRLRSVLAERQIEITYFLEYVSGGEVQLLWSLQLTGDDAFSGVGVAFSPPTPVAPDLTPFPAMTLP